MNPRHLPASTLLVPGSTPISGGTDKRVLFQDGTAVGESASLRFDKTLRALFVDIVVYPRANAAQLTADVNDWAVNTYSFVTMQSDASRTVTGIAAGQDGQVLHLVNIGSFDIVFANQNAGSAAGNRIITGTGASVTVSPDQWITLIYDGGAAGGGKWRIL